MLLSAAVLIAAPHVIVFWAEQETNKNITVLHTTTKKRGMPIFISLKCNNSNSTLAVRSGFDLLRFLQVLSRECIITGAAGARTRRSLGHHLLHPLMILRLLVLCAPADFGTQSSPGCTCTCRSKILMHSLGSQGSSRFLWGFLLVITYVKSSKFCSMN